MARKSSTPKKVATPATPDKNAACRTTFLQTLADEVHGGVIVGNVVLALEDNILKGPGVKFWADKACDLLAAQAARCHHTAAIKAVHFNTAELQRRGRRAHTNVASPPEVVVFAQTSKVASGIAGQASRFPEAAGAPETAELALFIQEMRDRAQAARRASPGSLPPEIEMFDSRRLVWYAKREGDFDVRIEKLREETRNGSGQELLVALLRFLGLPIAQEEVWMMISFAASDRAELRRPTAFDGIDGMFFKQKPHALTKGSGGWGRTTDLGSLGEPSGRLSDGALEAVGRPLTIGDVIDCEAFVPVPNKIDPANIALQSAYSRNFLPYVAPGIPDWRDVALGLGGRL